MKQLMPDLRTLALETAPGRLATAGILMARAALARDAYSRASALLRAWRATHFPFVVRKSVAFLNRTLRPHATPVPLRENPLLRSFVDSRAAREVRAEFSDYPVADRVRMRYPRPDEDEARQGDLIVLKAPDPETGEKGVLLIKYSEAFARFAALFEVERLVREYMIVLEPSWWGYQEAAFFMFVGSDAEVVVQAQAASDFEFLDRHGLTLVPLRLGAGDWIDPNLFQPSEEPPEYDVVMVSSWNPFKRHRDLLQALRTIRDEHGRTVKTALIGYPSGLTARDIHGWVSKHGLTGQVDIFDRIPQTQVADIVARSRVYVLLSRREGANKAMYEAMFCDIPVLAPQDHKGINHSHINAQTGEVFGRGDLVKALVRVLDAGRQYSPRTWALENTGYQIATERLRECLAEIVDRAEGVWNHQSVPKINRPNLRYASAEDRLRFDAVYDEKLVKYLRRTSAASR